ncbi:MAG: two-component regulator propeller domain-containing protein [Bacteroidales bacterium]
MKHIRFCLWLIFILLPGCLYAATGDNVRIQNFSYKDGLTTSAVNNVFKDSKGFLWICSNNGLFRFDGYNFRKVHIQTGTQQSFEVYCITEDQDRNFFIGTDKGIVFYDTHLERFIPLVLDRKENFKVYQVLLTEDRIWLASDIGLIITGRPGVDGMKDVFPARVLLPDSSHRRTTQDNIINTLFIAPGSSSVWVGTNGALYELNPATLRFQLINSYFQNSIRSISPYKTMLLVSSWDGGIFLVDPVSQQLAVDPFVQEANKIIGNKRVMSAFIDNMGRLWIATFGSGLFIFGKDEKDKVNYVNYRNSQGQERNLGSDFIKSMYFDSAGIVWLGTYRPALAKVFFRKDNLRVFDLTSQTGGSGPGEILTLTNSTDGSKFWVTTNGAGICLFDTRLHTFRKYDINSASGLRLQSNELVLSYQDKVGNLWIVYRRAGLYVVPSAWVKDILHDRMRGFVRPLDANSLAGGHQILNSYITTIYEDSHSRLWFGSWASLHVVEPLGESTGIRLDENVAAQFRTTRIYSDLPPAGMDFPISSVQTILESGKNRYILGTLSAGVIQIDETAPGKFTGKKSELNSRLLTGNVKFIRKDRKNNIWIGTNAGLGYLNAATDSFKLLGANDGLSSEDVNDFAEDRNANIWVSTSNGISEIMPANLSMRNFFNASGENDDQFLTNASVHASDGWLCFSTSKSIVMIHPDSAGVERPAPPLWFTGIRIDNMPVYPKEKHHGAYIIDANINECRVVNVPYNHTLSLEFAALDFLTPEQVSYKYRIGNNSQWILLNPGQRSLTLPNLSHGEYTLGIRLANSTGDAGIRTVLINYLPPFWLTKTAYIVYLAMALALLLLYRRTLIQRIHQRSLIEKERFERKKLEELDKMKTEFFSNISHEFRTPLSLIIGPLEKLTEVEELSGKNRERIRLVLKNSNRLLKLTNEMMDFSKLEKNLLVPDFQLCDLVYLVNESCQQFNNLAELMKLDFKINSSFDRLELPVDRGMIEKVLFNLLSNAFKFTPANGMIMVNLTRSQEQENEMARLSVVNTGEGIEKNNLSRIFDRYYQVNNVQNRNVEGTGIGLALVKSFVELHHGRIDVKSEQGVETCFDIYLPLVQEKFVPLEGDTTAGSVVSPGQTPAREQADLSEAGTSRLLIVEDEEDILNFLMEELAPGFSVIPARDGEEGFRLASAIIPDLIITDVMMPGLSGIELCRKLKNQVITSHIPVLILSAKTSVEQQIEGLEMGADVYMIKPFHIDHLKAQINRLISFKQSIHSEYAKTGALIPQGTVSNKLDEEFIKKVTVFVEKNISNPDLSVDLLADCVALSKVQTYRKIKAITGLSIVEFIRTIRLKKAAQLISERRLNNSEIAFETGFSSPSYFTKCFHDHFGKTPSEYASGNGM